MVCDKCGGFKNIYDRSERTGNVFTQCWKCGNETMEPDPILARPWSEIQAAGDRMRARRKAES